ncbi:MAG: glycosyltransferase [Actinomycetota bacterium]
MKISIGSNIIKGPWGGGNRFAISLSEYLENKGWNVTTGLSDGDIDIILMTEPRITSKTGAYNQRQISKYLIKKPDTIVIHRINECDERKGTKGINKYLMRANRVADYTIFISDFLKNLFIKNRLFKSKESSAVRNGADADLFNREGREKWDGKSPLRIMTHHWGYSRNKGFDIYEKLGKINSIGNLKIEFSYIGKIPDDVKPEGIKIILPLSGKELADELKSNHIYVTGSMNEPAGMHHIEGAMCGLPLIYRNSGALPEYCEGFGVMFESVNDFEDKLKEIIEKYDYYYDRLVKYPYNSDLMCMKYEKTFVNLLQKKVEFNKAKRRLKYMILFIEESFLQVLSTLMIKLKKLIKKMRGFK